jgi:opacity protein-like surface antigen
MEAVLAFGIGDDELKISDGVDTITLALKLGNMIGGYGKFAANLGPNITAYGKIGLVSIEYDIDAGISGFGSATVSEDTTGLSYGFGISIGLSNQAAITLKYLQLPDVDFEGLDIESTAISIGFETAI